MESAPEKTIEKTPSSPMPLARWNPPAPLLHGAESAGFSLQIPGAALAALPVQADGHKGLVIFAAAHDNAQAAASLWKQMEQRFNESGIAFLLCWPHCLAALQQISALHWQPVTQRCLVSDIPASLLEVAELDTLTAKSYLELRRQYRQDGMVEMELSLFQPYYS